jgi:hypothetical protein
LNAHVSIDPPIVRAALDLAAAGLPVFPCNAKKQPIVDHGFLDATTDPAIIRKTFTQAAKLIGVPTGPASGIDVLDFDYKHGAKAWEDANQHRLPETRIHQTKSGGRHHLYRCNPSVRNSESRIGPGVDVRGSGGYIIIPPSTGYSVISDAPMAPWPEWLLVAGLALPPPPKPRPVSSAGPYVPTSNARLEGYRKSVLKTVSQAAEGQKHTRLRNAGRALGGIQEEAGFSDAEAIEWLIDALPDTVLDWENAKKTAEWALASGREDPIKLEDRPYTKSTRPPEPPPPADDRFGDDWSGDEPPPEIDDPGYQVLPPEALASDPIRALVAEFNARFMVVSEGGKILLYEPDTDTILKRRFYQRLDFSDFHKMWLNRTVRTGVDKKGEPVFNQVAPLWLRHPDRRQFIRGVIFDPGGSNRDPQKLNLWQGFAVQPRPGSWAKMKDHILKVICDGNSELNDYVLNWSARMVQFPAEQGEVAVVLKGVEGTGKGTLANALRRIMGQHALKISNAKHLVGNFNSHLRDCVFLFADEAFFAGDKQHVGVLKSIITEDSLTIEAKYANAVETPNYLHLMMASNEEWVVPAGLEARRFLVLLTAATKVRNFQYFKAIHAEMDNGGYEAMLHDLLNRDLTDFNVRDVPDTAGLREQKKLSLGTSEAWWMDCLHRGYVYKSRLGLERHFGEWHDVVTTEVLFASYTEFAKAKNERHPMEREAFGRFMVSMGGKASKPRNAVVGEHITDVLINQHGDTTRKAALVRKERSTGYSLCDLKAARAAFTDATKLPVEWESDDEEPS